MSAYTPTARATSAPSAPPRAAVTPLGRWSWAAVPFVGLFLAGLFASGATAGSGRFPSPFSDGAVIQKYFADNHDAVVRLSLLQALSAVALIMLTAGLTAFARRSAGESSPLPALALASGTLASAFLLLSTLLQWEIVRPHAIAQPTFVRVLHDLSYLSGGPAHVVALGLLIGAVSAAGRRGALPGWLRTLGLLVAVASVLSLAALATQQAVVLLPVARFVGFAWLLMTALVVARRR